MSDRKKVIVALENCADFVKCRDCPWDECDGMEHYVVNGVPRNLLLDALELLKAQEKEINMVEVVRCEDCKFWQRKVFRIIDDKECHLCEIVRGYSQADWFCADGKRK